MSVAMSTSEEKSATGRLRLWVAIAAGAVTIGSGLLALANAHGDLLHRLDRVEARVAEIERIPERLDTMSRQLTEIGAELRLVRDWFKIPGGPQ